jgi:general stress protein YciG
MNGKNDKRGFAAMDSEKRRALASKGGKAAHAQGHAHEFNSDEARDAGSKGGKAIAKDRNHMATIGRLGGLARRRRQTEEPAESAGE